MSYITGMKIKTGLVMLAMASRCMAGDIEDFVGGVYGESGVKVAPDMVITADGPIIDDGTGFITPNGYYGQNGDVTWGERGIVTQDKDLFYGSTTGISVGEAYFDNEGNTVFVIGDGITIKP